METVIMFGVYELIKFRELSTHPEFLHVGES